MSYTGTKGRVLIATTDAGFLKGLRTHLTGAGYEVVCECSDGKEAVREAAACHPTPSLQVYCFRDLTELKSFLP